MTNPIVFRTATELAAATRSGELRVRDVVEAHLDRIDELNPTINAIVSARPRAEVLAEADALDAAPVQGPLHGLPVAVKDLEDVAGLPTRAGSTITPDTPAAADGLIAQRLRAAGAVIVGKTNTPEFGAGSHTFNEVFGVTRNPWDTDRSAGGSSGGAAAALAARMLPIADGSDLGGSLRNPAGFCNVVGLRPSIGRVPSTCETSTHLQRLGLRGPMGRTVSDVGLLLSALAGPSGADPLSLPDDAASFAPPIEPASGVRVGWIGDAGVFTCEPEVLGVARAAADRIGAVGGSVDDTTVDLTDAMNVFRVMRGLEFRGLDAQLPAGGRDRLKATVRENIAYGQSLTVDDVMLAEAQRASLHHRMHAFFDTHDVLALPTAQVAPFPVETEYPTVIDGVEMVDYLDWMTAACIITPTGCPAISIPAGFTTGGLPVGLQLVAPVGGEHELLRVAAALESVLGLVDLVPPGLGPDDGTQPR